MTIDELEIEYQKQRAVLERLCSSIVSEIEKLLEPTVQLAFPIQSRIKKWSSIVDKLNSGRYSIKKSILELQDILGLRILLLFRKDVDLVLSLIRGALTVVREYDTEERLEDNQFGYSSVHLVCRIPDTWTSIPSFKGLNGINFEIQIRTLSQHAWAEFSNVFQYKKENNVPRELRRATGRISALLEMVDFEFERILNQRDSYVENIDEINLDDEELNVNILERILDAHLPKENKLEKENYSALLEDLNYFKITKADVLKNFIKENIDESLREDRTEAKSNLDNTENKSEDEIKRLKAGIYFKHVGLIRIALQRVYKDQWFNEYESVRKKNRIKI